MRVIARYVAERPEGVDPGDFNFLELISKCTRFEEVTGNAGDDVFGRVDVRDDVLDGTPDDVAARKPRDRDRGAEQRDHVAPGHPLG